MNRMRSIDPPTLPAWAEEMTDSVKKKMDAPEDPAALAKRLAAEAKAKLSAAKDSPTEDPAAMAKRLATEAKAKLASGNKTKKKKKKKSLADRAINPKALAKKLAAEKLADLEAKRQQNLDKLQTKNASDDADAISTMDLPGPADEPVEAAPVALATASPPKKKKKKKSKATPQKAKKSLRERAQKTKSLSAAEALAAAMATEASAPAKPKPASSKPAAATPATTKPASANGAPVVAEVAAAAAPETLHDAAQLIAKLLPKAEVATPVFVENAAVFQALWKAHRARAIHDNDLNRVATASVLLDAIDRLPAGHLVAARLTIEGSDWAAWVDLGRGIILGAAQPADVFLAGL